MELTNLKQVESRLATLQSEYPNTWIAEIVVDNTHNEIVKVTFHSGEVGSKSWTEKFSTHENYSVIPYNKLDEHGIIFKY